MEFGFEPVCATMARAGSNYLDMSR